MKNVLPILVLCFAPFVLTGCDFLEDGEPDRSTLEVHFQYFYASSVRVTVDQHIVFDGAVNESSFSGPVEVVPLEVTAGSHELAVTINGAVEGRTTFNTENTQVIGVSYIPELDEIRFEFFAEQPL
ncbi:MAG TPA: hypothetical protein VKP65_23180 [Rhodothermales bacterium]|nr:hypothetical protein [Rhodothermales bacterium]